MAVGTLAGTVAADDATIETRVASLDWPHIASDLDARGSAVIAGLLASHECAALAALSAEVGRFRRRVVMARHGSGRGEYRYFAYPTPAAGVGRGAGRGRVGQEVWVSGVAAALKQKTNHQ